MTEGRPSPPSGICGAAGFGGLPPRSGSRSPFAPAPEDSPTAEMDESSGRCACAQQAGTYWPRGEAGRGVTSRPIRLALRPGASLQPPSGRRRSPWLPREHSGPPPAISKATAGAWPCPPRRPKFPRDSPLGVPGGSRDLPGRLA